MFSVPCPFGCLVFQVEALVRLAEGHEGCKIRWDEWKKHVVIPSIRQSDLVDVWVSGCRIFCLDQAEDGPNAELEVYDFSKRGRVECLGKQFGPYLSGVRYLLSITTSVRLPWLRDWLIDGDSGCNSVVFFRVSVLHVSFAAGLNDGLRVVGQIKESVPEPERVLQIWKF